MRFRLDDLPMPVMVAALAGWFLAAPRLGLLRIRPRIARITGVVAELNGHGAVLLSAFGHFHGNLLGLRFDSPRPFGVRSWG